MNARILFIDDDPNVLAAFQRNLRKSFPFVTAQSGPEAMVINDKEGPFAVVVCDMQMPGMNGLQVLDYFRQNSPATIRLMLTGNSDQQTAVDAVNRGQVFRFLNKPCSNEDMIAALQEALKAFERAELEKEILENTVTGSIKTMIDILGMVSPEAVGRGQRLRESVHALAAFINAPDQWEIELGALLSTIGYTALPPGLLRKMLGEGNFTAPEARVVQSLPQIGHDLLIGIPRLKGVAEIVLYQNQHFDGNGYPGNGVSGENIPLGARMLKIISDRLMLEEDGVVKKAALSTMRGRPNVYDPHLLQKAFDCFPDFLVNSVQAGIPVLSLQIAELKPGQVLVSDLVGRTGSPLLSRGSRLTETIIRRLKNYAVLGDVQEPILVQNPPAGAS